MRYAWLEDFVEEGLVRKEAAAAIYRDCSDLLEKNANEGLKPEISKALIYGIGQATLLSGAAMAARNMRRRILDAETKAKIDVIRSRLVTQFPPKDREKAEARYNEVIRFAPSLATNEEFMRKYLRAKVRNGMTDRDTQALIGAQLKINPGIFGYSSMAKTASEETSEAKAVVAANSMAEACMAAHIKLSDEDFCKSASHILRVMGAAAAVELEKTAAPKKLPGGFTDQLKNVLYRVAPHAIIAGGISGGYLASKAIQDRNMAKKLEESYHKAIQMSPDSVLTEKPAEARQAFKTLAHFAPHVAAEPYAAKAFMSKIVSYEQGPATGDIKDLADIEKNIGAVRGGMLDMLGKSMAASGGALMKGVTGTWEDTTQPHQDALNADIATRIDQGI